MIADRLGRHRNAIHRDRPVHLLGLDSLMAAEVLHAVEETYRVSLPLQTLLGGASIADLAATIEEKILHPVIEVTT